MGQHFQRKKFEFLWSFFVDSKILCKVQQNVKSMCSLIVNRRPCSCQEFNYISNNKKTEIPKTIVPAEIPHLVVYRVVPVYNSKFAEYRKAIMGVYAGRVTLRILPV